ncbi:MAG: M48 family metallopeptidase [Gammaproteobacteria bacterium]
MNFYESQDQARRRTALLVVYFALAVLCITLALNGVFYLAAKAARSEPLSLQAWLAQPYWLWISVAVGALILLGTLHTSFRLRGGGQALAAMVGARRIDPGTQAMDERRLLNVVEEIAIASGTPVPALYVLDSEAGINAFVAGTRPSETVLVVTRGALDSFDRDELQGVVAHEYSHIFNGDMRLNLRLMGVLAGILVIGQIGRLMLRSGVHGRNRKGGQWALIGLAVLIIGYIGLFFGALIKAAVSRQREFLADASAVQFTRMPDGIAGALYKIKQHAAGSLLDNPHAEDLSHFCFGESVRHAFSGLLATHPPLEARIEAIKPGFVPRQITAASGAAVAAPGAMGFAGSDAAMSPPQVADAAGTVTRSHIEHARHQQAEWPAELAVLAHATDDAPRLVYGLLLAASPAHGRPVLIDLVERRDPRGAADLEALAAKLDALPRQARLPLLNLALPALKQAGSAARQRLQDTVRALIAADGRFTVFEFALEHLLRDHLRDTAGEAVPVTVFRFADVAADVRLLLSVLARAGSPAPAAAAAAFRQAWRPFALGEAEPAASAACTLDALDAALDRLAQVSPLLKKNLIEACADCVQHDGRVTAAEHDLLQVIALTLDCPLPPLP